MPRFPSSQTVSRENFRLSRVSFTIWYPSVQQPSSRTPTFAARQKATDINSPFKFTPPPYVTASRHSFHRICDAHLSNSISSKQSLTATYKSFLVSSSGTPFAGRTKAFDTRLAHRCILDKFDSSITGAVRRRPQGSRVSHGIVACHEPLTTSKDEQLRMEAYSCFKGGDLNGACELLKRCIRICPDNGRAWQDFAKVEGLRRQSARATAAILKKALEHNPRNPYLWQSLGFLMWRLRKYYSARNCFEKGIGVDPSHSPLYTTYAKMEFELRHVAEARELLEKGLVAGAVDARLYHCWGLMEMKLGNAGRARQLLRKGLAIDKQNPFIWQSLASMARKEGNANDARVCYENALKTGRGGVAVLDALAKLEAQEGNDQTARGLFAEGVQADPNDVRILHSWSVFEYQRGEFQTAKDLIGRALRMNSSDSFLWSHCAKIEEAFMNYPLARALFKRACAVRPEDWRAWDRWSTMEHKLGNTREAEILLKESFRIRFKAKGAFTILANNINDKYS